MKYKTDLQNFTFVIETGAIRSIVYWTKLNSPWVILKTKVIFLVIFNPA